MTEHFTLAPIDIVITVAYVVGILVHGIRVARRRESADDYFLAGRTLPWYLIGLSLYASNMSGSSFVGLMGASYSDGLVVFNYEWTAAFVLVFFAVFMLPRFLRARLWTLPEFLESRFDRRSRMAFSAFTLLAIVFIDTAGALYAGGIVVTTVFDIPLWEAVAALAAVAGVYTILGGLSAVVVTDAVQAVLLMIGAAAIFGFGLREVGGWGEMLRGLEAVGPERVSLVHPAGDPFLPWYGIFGVILLGFYYWTLNQFVVQRTLGSRDLDQGRKGAVFAGLLKMPNLFLMILPGAFAVLLFPAVENPDTVFPRLAFELLPAGFRGLVLTGVVAAIMSSLDSALNAAATLVTIDFVRTARPDASDDRLVLLGRVVTAVVMVVAAVYSPLIAGFRNLFGYFQSSLSYVTPPVVAVYLLGIFWPRANRHGAFWTLVGALAVGVPLFVTKEITGVWAAAGLPDVHYLVAGSFMFLGGCAVCAGVSLATGAPSPERAAHAFDAAGLRRALARGTAGPWWRDYRWQSAGLALLVVACFVAFW
ncbi:MAG: sodium:solute symporter [Gemmatimonadota bacterium]